MYTLISNFVMFFFKGGKVIKALTPAYML